MNVFNEKEYLDICAGFGKSPFIKEVSLKYTNISFFNKMKNSIERDRRGEVVFCVIRPDGSIITVTCSDYPDGIYRIPTGGINHGEDIIEALHRETKEELGLETVIDDFAGVIKIRFEHNDDAVMFYSYIFILKETGGRLLEDAADDEISAVREVDIAGLETVTSALYDIPGKWNDWGRFRHITSSAVLDYLKGKV